MVTLWKTYGDARAARRAADGLSGAGVPARDIHVMIGTRSHDVRREPVGQFAGMLSPDAPVGTFGGQRQRRSQGAGSFAGSPDRQRQGSFADVDRELIITCGGGERTCVVGHRALGRLLHELALDDGARDLVLRQLDLGHATVLVELAEIAASDARARLEEPAHAA